MLQSLFINSCKEINLSKIKRMKVPVLLSFLFFLLSIPGIFGGTVFPIIKRTEAPANYVYESSNMLSHTHLRSKTIGSKFGFCFYCFAF